DSTHRIQPLVGTNYTTWAEEMQAYLRSKGLWRLVNGQEVRHSSDSDEQEKWDVKQDKAAGELMLNIHPEQRVHIRAHKDDPIAAWKALQALFVQQKPGMRFAAYDESFSIRKRQDEALPSVAARVEQAMSRIQELRPKDFNLNKFWGTLLALLAPPLRPIHPLLPILLLLLPILPPRTSLRAQEMQVFIPVIPLTLSVRFSSMLTSIGMQTLGPLLI
ncbi:hypothetical protein HYDPIDRAFT_85014, partial [Hydnomerulius pinastri MD-312]